MPEPTLHALVVAVDVTQLEPGHELDARHLAGECPDCNTDPFTMTIECPGLSPRCEAWEECGVCRDALAGIDDEDGRDAYLDEDVHHGEEHRTFDGELCVRSGACYVVEALNYEIPDSAWDIARKHGPGRYEVTWEGGDFGDLTLGLAAAPEAGTGHA